MMTRTGFSRRTHGRARPICVTGPAGRGASFRAGLSLFEIVIALAIFVGSIAAIGQLISVGVRGALIARLQSQAVIRCESKLAEVAAGITPMRAASGAAFPDDVSWTWSIALAPGSQPNLYLVEVTASHAAGTQMGRISYTLRRMVHDPQLQMMAYEKALEQQQSSTSQSSSSSSSGSSSGGGTK